MTAPIAPSPLPSPVPSQGALTANLLCVASMLIWAMGFPAVEVLLPVLPTLPLTALRMTLGTLFLLPIWLALDGPGALARANWGKGLVVGGIGFGLGAWLLIVAQSLSDPVTVAVVTAVMPVVGIALECLLDGRSVTLRLVIGLVLGCLGGVVAYAARLSGMGLGLGVAATLVSLVAFCWGSRETVRGFADMSPIGRTTLTLAGAALATGVAAVIQRALGGPPVLWDQLGPPQIGALALYAFGALAISQVLWILGVARLGIGLASMHINAAPLYVMIFVWMLGGAWNWIQVAGAAIVALGVVIAQAPGRRARMA